MGQIFLSKAVSVHNETKRHITGLALPGSEIYFFVHLVQVQATPAAFCGFQAGICYHGNGNRDVVSTPLGGHAHPVHRTQQRNQFSLEVLVGHGPDFV